jgi:putative Mg2+ transporter-C (MgtC) family protein
MDTIGWQKILVRLLFAFILGSAVGIERRWDQTKQNIQANTQVALGAAMFSILVSSASETKLVSQLVLGISILCAGIFLQQQARQSPPQHISIITQLWCAGAAGSLVGYGLFLPAYISVSIIFITNLLFPASETSLNLHPEEETVDDLDKAAIAQIIEPIIPQETYYQCYVSCLAVDEAQVLSLLVQLGKEQQLTPTKISSRNLDNNTSLSAPEIEVQIDFVPDSNISPLQLQQVLISLKSKLKITSASWSEIGKNNQFSAKLEQDNYKN